MTACFCTGACKATGQCPSAKTDYFGTFLSTMNAPTSVTYQKIGRKWVKVPLSLTPERVEPAPQVRRRDPNEPRGYNHVGMDHF